VTPATAEDGVQTARLAERITRRASTQTYLTIRLLVDRDRAEDAYRAYAYFRWLDDVLDVGGVAGPDRNGPPGSRRLSLVQRQQQLLEWCLAGDVPACADPHEAMLVDLVKQADPEDQRLESYLRHMMLVMTFDARRRGRLVSGSALDGYTRWLAIAVSDAMHYFIGHDTPRVADERRFLAVSGAHILHMLRDTHDDLQAGYYNVPREVLQVNGIGPGAINSDGYRRWVEHRVRLARAHLEAGRAYFATLDNRRHRLAGMAYIARFSWLADTIERDSFRLRPDYDRARTGRTHLRMSGLVLAWMAGYDGHHAHQEALAANGPGQ
jgi:phytoene/squalene synthetase